MCSSSLCSHNDQYLICHCSERDHHIRNHDHRPHGSVLVTGGAGFIGFHTALQLATMRKWTEVVVIDNFNSYYDVGLKEKRASILLQQGKQRRERLVVLNVAFYRSHCASY